MFGVTPEMVALSAFVQKQLEDIAVKITGG
jgi:hypothetical protein